MSRATINYDTDKELSCIKWNPLMSKFCYICKRCSTSFDTKLCLQRHKIECFINSVCQSLPDHGQGQSKSSFNSKSITSCILFPQSAIFAASAVPLEYCVPHLPIIRDEVFSSDPKSTDSCSGQRGTSGLKCSKTTISNPDKKNQKNVVVCSSSQMGSETASTPSSSIVVKHRYKDPENTIQNTSQGTRPIKVSFSQLAAEMYSLKGYKIPKLKSSNHLRVKEESKTSAKTPQIEVDDGIVPDSGPPTPAKPITVPSDANGEETREKDKQLEKLLLETSDYASNSSTTDSDSSRDNKYVDSDEIQSRKFSSTPPQLSDPDEDYETSLISNTSNLPNNFEVDEEYFAKSEIHEQSLLQVKMDAINDLHDTTYYMMLKSDGELEYVDIFTDEDGGLGWSMEPGQVLFLQQVEDGQIDNDYIDYFENDNDIVKKDGMHGQEGTTGHECHPVPVIDNQVNYLNENEVQEMLDLELGAVETVESEESFESEGGDDFDDLKLGLDDALQFQHFTTSSRSHSSCNSAKIKRKDNIHGIKNSTNFKNSQAKPIRNPHNIPNNLFTSVLEKTLLVKLRRCDGALTMPRLKPQQKRFEQIVIPQEGESSCVSSLLNQPPIEISIPSPEIKPHSEDQPVLAHSTLTTEASHANQPLKRKHNKEQREERWDIVNSAITDLKESASKTVPIKLKIKRRRLDDRVDSGELAGTTFPKDTSSPQFFNGFCKICGSNCRYQDAKTYYATSNPEGEFCCCTCFDIFNKDEWSVHNKTCHNVEEQECTIWNENTDTHSTTLGDNTVIERDFICSNCFRSMSKLI